MYDQVNIYIPEQCRKAIDRHQFKDDTEDVLKEKWLKLAYTKQKPSRSLTFLQETPSHIPSCYFSVTHANIMKRSTDCMSIANRQQADLQVSRDGDGTRRIPGEGRQWNAIAYAVHCP